jgi:predicted phage baseplate assembly protein
MSLPAPLLDDRTFQELVNEAKLHLQKRCPEWTNHNVSDPGVALIEAFAWMADQLIYRVNRVPDRNYVKFLELMGVQLYPPSAAHLDMSFRLSSHQDVPVSIAAGTRVSTRRTAVEPSMEFATTIDLQIPPAVSTAVLTQVAGGPFVDRAVALARREAFAVFSPEPVVGDALYVGLDQPAPSTILLAQFLCEIAGHGIDPSKPPLAWDAWTGEGWVGCDIEKDSTAGLNASGAIEIHLPPGHTESTISGSTAAWVRCRVIDLPGVRPYRSSPRVVSVTAATVGGNVEARNCTPVVDEVLGTSDGMPGQSFVVRQPPVLKDDGPLVMTVGTRPRRAAPGEDGVEGTGAGTPDVDDGAALEWREWNEVTSFADSGDEDDHFTLDATTGEVRFGPVVRSSDGTRVQHGAVPPQGAILKLPAYRTGGGSSGNVAARSVNVLRSSIPYVAVVYNRAAAIGGADGESIEEAKVRGPLDLRSRNRAVTAEDFEDLTRRAAPEVARVVCVAADGGVRILAIPKVLHEGVIPLAELRLPDSARERVLKALELSRMVGVRVSVEPPSYVGIRVDARVYGQAQVDPDRLSERCRRALFAYFNPVIGGPDGTGWPFGRPAQVGEVYAVLAKVRGVDYVEDAAMFRANPITQEVSEQQDRIDLEPTHLLMSVEHDVDVLRP